MDNLNSHSEHANQPQGQDLPQMQQAAAGSANPALFCFSLEQHRLQLDQVLQLYNEQVRVSLQQEMSIQNLTQLNLRTTDALIQKVEEVHSLKEEAASLKEEAASLKEEVACLKEEVACLHVELQRKQQRLLAACQLVVMLQETNESLNRRPPPVQQEMNSHVSSNRLDAPGSRDEALSGVRTAAETTIKIDLICKVCNSGHACMLLLPCQHLCACKPCGVRLTVCPVCGAVKGGVVEA